jgi:glutamate racemase
MAIVDSTATTARAVEAILKSRKLARNGSAGGERTFLVTDAPERFARVGQIFLGAPIDPAAVELVDLR